MAETVSQFRLRVLELSGREQAWHSEWLSHPRHGDWPDPLYGLPAYCANMEIIGDGKLI